MTDQELIEKIVNDQVSSIRLQKQYRDNPLACLSPTKEHKEEIDRLWDEAIERGLNEKINQLVIERLKWLDKADEEILPIIINNYALGLNCMRYEGK